MLTYRTGSAGAPSAAKNMAEHLYQQTLPPEMAVMADYYEQGVTVPTLAETVLCRYGKGGEGAWRLSGPLDDLAKAEMIRLSDSQSGTGTITDEIAVRAVSAFHAAGLIERGEAQDCLERFGVISSEQDMDRAIEAAQSVPDHSSAVATPRRDMSPALAQRLGIDTGRGLKPDEVAHLLNGQRADGQAIAGKQVQAATLPLTQIYGLDGRKKPTRDQLSLMLDGKTVSGEELPDKVKKNAVKRLLTALGSINGEVSVDQLENILAGKLADGKDLSDRVYMDLLETSKSRIGYIDLTFSAPKSLSVAWAFAPTNAERAILHQAHIDAVESVMQTIEETIGRARKGKGGKDGYEPGGIGWVSFQHYTARPTVAVVKTDTDGNDATELLSVSSNGGRVPGDMQVHTHVAVFNAVETASGRVGGLDLAQLDGRIHEWGALYQAYLAVNLRAHGVEVGLDNKNEMARLEAVPESVITQFSKRTQGGTEAARNYAASLGIDWDSLPPERKIGLLKNSVQDPKLAKSDDLSDMATWAKMARTAGYTHRSVLRPDGVKQSLSRDERLDLAYAATMPILEKQFDRKAVIDGAGIRVAAAKGLIVAGIESAEDINTLTKGFRERGINRRGENAGLIWGTIKSKQGREKTAITTTLDLREEKELIRTVKDGAKDKSSSLTREQINAGIKKFPNLDFSTKHGKAQRKVMEAIGTGGRISLSIGVAGSGKSTLLKPLVQAWEKDGRVVHGIALAWRQSDDLIDAGIEGRTKAVAAFIKEAERGKLQLDQKAVVVIDEIGLLGTRQLNEILTLQKETGFQIVMLGDQKQMQSVEAGPVISLLQKALGKDAVPELLSSVRQATEEERQTTLMFREGQVKDAVTRKVDNGTLIVVPGGYQEAIQKVTDLWEERRDANYSRGDFSITISAPTNKEAFDISVAVRKKLQETGEVSADIISIMATDNVGTDSYRMNLADGDKIRLFEGVNIKFSSGRTGNIGRNGSVLDIVRVNDSGLVLRNHHGNEGFVSWEQLQGRDGVVKLAYGYALTTHTAQGSTVTEHIHAMPKGSQEVTAFGAYTSGSRHKEQSYIVTSDGAEREEIIGRRPLGDKRNIKSKDVIENIISNLSRQDEKESAVSLVERAANLRHGTIKTVQSALHGIETNQQSEDSINPIGKKFRNYREARVVEKQAQEISKNIKSNNDAISKLSKSTMFLAEKIIEAVKLLRDSNQKRKKDKYWDNMSPDGFSKSTENIQANKRPKGQRL